MDLLGQFILGVNDLPIELRPTEIKIQLEGPFNLEIQAEPSKKNDILN